MDDEFSRLNCLELANYLLETCPFDIPVGLHFTNPEAWKPLLEYMEPDREWNGTEAWEYFKQRWDEANLERALAEYNMMRYDAPLEEEPAQELSSTREMYYEWSDEILPRTFLRQSIPAIPYVVCLNGDRVWMVESIQVIGTCGDGSMDCVDRNNWKDMERGIYSLRYDGVEVRLRYPGQASFDRAKDNDDDSFCFVCETELVERSSVLPTFVDHHLSGVLANIVCEYAKEQHPHYEVEKNAPRLRKRKQIGYSK